MMVMNLYNGKMIAGFQNLTLFMFRGCVDCQDFLVEFSLLFSVLSHEQQMMSTTEMQIYFLVSIRHCQPETNTKRNKVSEEPDNVVSNTFSL